MAARPVGVMVRRAAAFAEKAVRSFAEKAVSHPGRRVVTNSMVSQNSSSENSAGGCAGVRSLSLDGSLTMLGFFKNHAVEVATAGPCVGVKGELSLDLEGADVFLDGTAGTFRALSQGVNGWPGLAVVVGEVRNGNH
jgi:hypothetical protein